MTLVGSLASKIYHGPEIHELIGFVYWVSTGKFLF